MKTRPALAVALAVLGGCQCVLDVTALALVPKTPTILYAGTASGRIFRTASGGATWKQVLFPSAPFPGAVDALAVDSVVPSTLYVATKGQGIFKSVNCGSSW